MGIKIWNMHRQRGGMTAGKSEQGWDRTTQGREGPGLGPLSPSILSRQRPFASLQSYLGTEASKGSEAEWSKEQNKKGADERRSQTRQRGKQRQNSLSAALNGSVYRPHRAYRLETEEAKPFLASSV